MNKSILIKFIVIFLVFFVIIIGTYGYWRYQNLYPSTDNAYVQANIVNIAAQVTGPLEHIYVEDHQAVKKGEPLFDILATAYEADFKKAEAEKNLAEKNAQRIIALTQKGYAPQSAADEALSTLSLARATLERAKLNLSFTHVTAPASGTLINFNLRQGSSVNPGFVLFSLVEEQGWWVDANYKETQLKSIHPGQKATIELDLYPNHVFKGIVEKVSVGSGSAFSLLPAENATGNWVKVTQRFPVKIKIQDMDSQYPLRVGASATVTIDTQS